MIIVGTKVIASDNSGVRFGVCIRILGAQRYKRAVIGDKIVIAVKNAAQHKKVKKHDVCTALVVRQTYNYRRYTGIYISFRKNAIVVIDKKRSVAVGTRFFGPLVYELRRKRNLKLVSLATSII